MWGSGLETDPQHSTVTATANSSEFIVAALSVGALNLLGTES